MIDSGGAIFVCCSGDNKGTEKSLVGQQRNTCELQVPARDIRDKTMADRLNPQ